MEEKRRSTDKGIRSFFSRHGKVEILVLLILGVVVGAIAKENISSRFTMGYEDYLVQSNRQSYDYRQMMKEVIEKSKAQQESGAQAPAGGAAACGV